MKTITLTTNGTTRTVEGKQFGNEFRIYRVFGDVTCDDALAEMAQDVACLLRVSGVERVTIK